MVQLGEAVIFHTVAGWCFLGYRKLTGLSWTFISILKHLIA